MTDVNDVPICTCFDDWHANNAGNHALTCPVIAAFAALTRERDEARKERDVVMKDGQLHPYWMTATREALQDALSFQGVMTRILQEENDELRTNLDAARTVTDAMVERAAKAWYEHATPYFWLLASQDTLYDIREIARAALTAAVTQEDA
jgi:hypothetical protein